MRLYGQEVADRYRSVIAEIKNGSDPSAYYNDIGNTWDYYPNRSDIVSRCREVAKVANNRIDAMHEHLDNLANSLTAFYSMADQRLSSIDFRALAIVEKINTVSKTVDDLCASLKNAEEADIKSLTAASVNDICKDVSVLAFATRLNTVRSNVSKNFESYKEYLETIGISNVTEEQVRGFLAVESVLTGMGFSNDSIYQLAPDLYKDNMISSISHIPGTEQTKYVKSRIRSLVSENSQDVILSRFQNFGNNDANKVFDHADRYFDQLCKNLSDDDLALAFNSFVNPENAFIGMTQAEKVDFMVRFAIGGQGYQGTDYDKDKTPESFFGMYYDQKNFEKTETHWCALYMTWCMAYSGFLNENDPIIPGFNIKNACDPHHCWAGQTEIMNSFANQGKFEPFSANCTPCVGDLLICHNNCHIAMVAGYDAEKKIVYTIEGNHNNSVSFSYYSIEDDLNRVPGTRDMIGFCKMGGERQDMDYMTKDRIDSAVPFDWNSLLNGGSDDSSEETDSNE